MTQQVVLLPLRTQPAVLQELTARFGAAHWIVPDSFSESRIGPVAARTHRYPTVQDPRYQTPELAASHRAYLALKQVTGAAEVHTPLAEGVAYSAMHACRGEWSFVPHGPGTSFSEPWLDRARATLLHTEDVVRAWRPPVPQARSQVTVTAIIPVYNLHQHLGETLTSLAAQTRPPEEILVVDDGSTDPDTVAALQALDAGSDGRIRVIRKEHSGLSATRNVAIAHARGSHILTLDADDMVRPELLSSLTRIVEAQPDLALATTLVSCFVDDPQSPTGGWCPLGFERRMLPVFNFASCATALMPRSGILAAGGYDESLPAYEDWDLYCRLAQNGQAVVYPEFLIDVRIRPDSMLRSMTRTTHETLRAKLMQKHSALSSDPGFSLRLLQSEFIDLYRGELVDPAQQARAMIESQLRYRLADAVNDGLKKVGVQRIMKGLIKPAADLPG